jgi:Ras-related protein Rab-28
MSAKVAEDGDEEDLIIKQFKIILVGDGAVGKTSIATRYTDDNFSQNYKQTVGVDFFIKRITIPRKILPYHLSHLKS